MNSERYDQEPPDPAMFPTEQTSDELEPETISRRIWAILGAIAVIGIFLVATALVGSFERRNNQPIGRVFVIPQGAGASVSNSTLISAIALPTEITFAPGEKAAISVKNEDSVALRAGPFVVLPGQVYTQRFPNPGEFFISCSVDPDESITVTVQE